MAPAGATCQRGTPGLDSMALITRILFIYFLIIMVMPITSGLPTKTERLISKNDLYYWVELDNGRIQCLLCPAGTYVKEVCTSEYSEGTCEICAEGTYIEFSSGLSECLPCSRCRDDQEEVTSCTVKKNTVCHCKKGTFCPLDQPCEICKPCTTNCPDDLVLEAPCNSTSDILCSPPGSSTNTNNNTVVIVTVPLVLFSIIIIGLWWKRRNTGSKLFGKLTLHICKGNEDRDEARGNLLSRDINLQLKEGIDSDTKDEIISKSCVVILQLVPIKGFEKLMLHLGLSNNEIERAKVENHGNVFNQNNAMLQTWYQNKDFEINSLLKALQSLGMKKAACDIADKLITEELYIQQTQHNT